MADGAITDRLETIRSAPTLEALYEETGRLNMIPGYQGFCNFNSGEWQQVHLLCTGEDGF